MHGRGGPFYFCDRIGDTGDQAFGDIGQTARLRIICDRFIAGHDSCELHRHLDSHADSDTRRFSKPGPDRTLPIYAVDTLSEEMDDRVVAAVTTTQPEPDQSGSLLRRLLSGPVVPPPPPKPVPSVLEQLLQRLLTEAQAPRPTPLAQAAHPDIEFLIRNLLPGTSAPVAWAQQGPMGRNWNTVVCFSCGKAGMAQPGALT